MIKWIKWFICWLGHRPLYGIEGHEYKVVKGDLLKCKFCGWFSWNGGEGWKPYGK